MTVIKTIFTLLVGLATAVNGQGPTTSSISSNTQPTTTNQQTQVNSNLNVANQGSTSGNQQVSASNQQTASVQQGGNQQQPGTTTQAQTGVTNQLGGTANQSSVIGQQPTTVSQQTGAIVQQSVGTTDQKQQTGATGQPQQTGVTSPQQQASTTGQQQQSTTAGQQPTSTSEKVTKTTGPAAQSAPVGCQPRLLNTLRLSGLKPGEKAKDMKICPITADDNCCSPIDEVKIINLWNYYSAPKVNKVAQDTIESVKKILDLDPYVRVLNATLIRYHYSNLRWRKTNETQCFNGKFFLEQVNYDLFDGENTIINQFSIDLQADLLKKLQLANTMNVLSTDRLRDTIKSAVIGNATLLSYLSHSLGNFAQPFAANITGNVLADELAKLPATEVNLVGKKANETVVDYLQKVFKFNQTIGDVLSILSDKYANLFLQTSAASLHLNQTIDYLQKTFLPTLKSNTEISSFGINVERLIGEIIKSISSDITLKKYLLWFLVPEDITKFKKVYNYLLNRLFMLVANSVLKSRTTKDVAPATVMATVLSVLKTTKFEDVLKRSYGEILGNAVTRDIVLGYLSQNYNPAPNQPAAALAFLNASPYCFNSTAFKPLSSLTNFDPNTILPTVKTATTDILKQVSIDLEANFTIPIETAVTRFCTLNRQLTEYAEFIGDQKEVCAVVYKHNIVREAIFNSPFGKPKYSSSSEMKQFI